MWYDDKIKAYGDISKKINEKYCENMGYTFIFSNKRFLHDRHPAWEKIQLCLNTLETNKYDYIFWIDADAVFNFKSNQKLEHYIDRYPNKDIIFSKDRNTYVNINNTGVMLIKNTDYSKNFLKLILNSKECNKFFNYRYWEQDCIDIFYKNNHKNLKENSISIDYGKLQSFPNKENMNIKNELVVHFPETKQNFRIEQLNKLLKLI